MATFSPGTRIYNTRLKLAGFAAGVSGYDPETRTYDRQHVSYSHNDEAKAYAEDRPLPSIWSAGETVRYSKRPRQAVRS